MWQGMITLAYLHKPGICRRFQLFSAHPQVKSGYEGWITR